MREVDDYEIDFLLKTFFLLDESSQYFKPITHYEHNSSETTRSDKFKPIDETPVNVSSHVVSSKNSIWTAKALKNLSHSKKSLNSFSNRMMGHKFAKDLNNHFNQPSVNDANHVSSINFEEEVYDQGAIQPSELSREFVDLEESIDSFHEANRKWVTEIKYRIEIIFGYKVKERLMGDNLRSSNLSRDYSEMGAQGTTEDKTNLLLKLLSCSIPDFGYDSRMRCIIFKLKNAMKVSATDLTKDVEGQLAKQLKKGFLQEAQRLTAQSTKENSTRRKVMIGLGAIAGGLAVGVTAGLAAPTVLPFFAGLFGITAGASFLAGSTGAALFGVIFGAGGAGLASYKMNKRYRDIKDFKFIPIDIEDRMRVLIGASGWINKEEEIFTPWLSTKPEASDLYVLQCEVDAFKRLGSALSDFISRGAVGFAGMEALKTTAMGGAVIALSWPIAFLQAANLIDNPWSVCLNIAPKAGLILADALKTRAQGHRPVTLAGFSLGGLMIFECLQELAKDPENLGIIENVVLFGLPARIHPLEKWAKCRMIVAGRFIHCYSVNDWVLKFLYRSTSLLIGDIAGLNPIEGVDGIENVNMSNLVSGHLDYVLKMPEMMELFNL